VREVEGLRRKIHAIGDPPDIAELTELWREVQEKLHNVRLIGDLIVAAFFSETTATAQRKKLGELGQKVSTWLQVGEHDAELRGLVADLREGERGVPAFHWEIEFPEVFGDRVGFDCFVGNPPFLGGKRISTTLGSSYGDWLTTQTPEISGNADLVAHFFRRSFGLLCPSGAYGLIATNTISQGDTRRGGLRWICANGGRIYCAQRRFPWPGQAAVVVSVVHVSRAGWIPEHLLDGKTVPKITAFLAHAGMSEDPARLRPNVAKSFIGCDIKGQGFLFDDNDAQASPVREMERVIASNPLNRERIRPYIGGEEINESPSQSPDRWVICFDELEEKEAREWPELFTIVETKVQPDRMKKSGELARWPFWRFWRTRKELAAAISGLSSVLCIGQVSRTGAFVLLPSNYVFSHKVVVFSLDGRAAFAPLQSRVHECWARFFSSSLKDDLSYTPSDCFETFPFPPNYETSAPLLAIGETYYQYRAALMVSNKQGLTKTYNRFHDREDSSQEIAKLRELHECMDRAVLDAYGWTDIVPEYNFRVQLDESEHYTWSEDTRDEVLARLLEENQKRAATEMAEEAAHLNAAVIKASAKPRDSAKGKKENPAQLALKGSE
jgi:hypothetical protein